MDTVLLIINILLVAINLAFGFADRNRWWSFFTAGFVLGMTTATILSRIFG